MFCTFSNNALFLERLVKLAIAIEKNSIQLKRYKTEKAGTRRLSSLEKRLIQKN